MAEHELGLSRTDKWLIGAGFPLAGVAVGWALPLLARWLLSLPWVPFGGPIRLVAALDHGVGQVAMMAAGLLLGVVFVIVAVHETLRVTVADSELRLRLGDAAWVVRREDVSAVFVDGRLLVVLDRDSRQVVRERLERAGDRQVAEAFQAHGYPWQKQDPFGELFRRWVPDLPDLPAAVNAVLAARAAALTSKSTTDAAELRDEVQKLGYTVRDDGTTQHWRPLVRS
ncbi:YqeB family protein [Dactylosporangium sp. CA-152071]|uniref:YqeB family protein n=1 Tax=Dactylosporangium sp. CA-152071 TaxID=3239933 RepID=UPI003D8FEEF2